MIDGLVNVRPRRVEIPAEVRRGLARLGKVRAMHTLTISGHNYDDAISPGGRIQEKTLTKIVEKLRALDTEAGE